MDINEKKIEIIQHISQIRDLEMINEIERFVRKLNDDDRFYKRERFYDDGTPKDQVKEKPKRVSEARRKIKGIFNLYK